MAFNIWPYRKQPLRFVRVLELGNSLYEVNFWNIVVNAFNATAALIKMKNEELRTKHATIGIIPYERHMGDTMSEITYHIDRQPN